MTAQVACRGLRSRALLSDFEAVKPLTVPRRGMQMRPSAEGPGHAQGYLNRTRAGTRRAVRRLFGVRAQWTAGGPAHRARFGRTPNRGIPRPQTWVARIGPPAAPPAYLATISTEAHSILVFSTVESERGEPLVDTLLLDAHRIDPVAGALEHLDVWTSGAGIPLGGYGYDLMVLTSQSEAVFHFGAKAPSFAGFRTALFEHGSLFQSRDTKPSTAQFLERWIAAL